MVEKRSPTVQKTTLKLKTNTYRRELGSCYFEWCHTLYCKCHNFNSIPYLFVATQYDLKLFLFSGRNDKTNTTWNEWYVILLAVEFSVDHFLCDRFNLSATYIPWFRELNCSIGHMDRIIEQGSIPCYSSYSSLYSCDQYCWGWVPLLILLSLSVLNYYHNINSINSNHHKCNKNLHVRTPDWTWLF